MKKRVRVRIEGRVHGVFFRYTTHKRANTLGLTGWVKNKEDGSVEVLIEGDEKKVQELIDWCHIGPIIAKVTSVEINEEKYTGEFSSFEIQH